jgi:hypothetical protein
MANSQQKKVKNILGKYLEEENLTFRSFYPKVIVSYATGRRENHDTLGAGPGMSYASLVIQTLFKNGCPCISGLMIPAGTNWETYFLRIGGSRSQARVLVVLLTEAFSDRSPASMKCMLP